MTRCRSCLSALLAVLLAAAAVPGAAQLDPRLMASKTDFLDLYQQSTSAKAKPEILSVLDFSRSMAGMMFHPLFRNDDALNQDDENRTLSLALSTSTASSYQVHIIPYANNLCSSNSNPYYISVSLATGMATPSAYSSNPLRCAPPTPWGLALWCQTPAPYSQTAAVSFLPTSSTPVGGAYTWAVSAATSGNDTQSPFLITHANKSTTPLPTVELTDAAGNPVTTVKEGDVLTATAYLLHPPVEGEGIASKTLRWLYLWGLDPTTGASGTGYQNASYLTAVTTTTVDAAAGLYKSVATFTVKAYHQPYDPIQFGDVYVQKVNGVAVSGPSYGSPWKPGDVLTFATYLKIPGSATAIFWNGGAVSLGTCSALSVAAKDKPASLTNPATPWTATWTVPAGPCSLPAGVPKFSLDPTKGLAPTSGITYLTSPWQGVSATLVKPDGTVVSASDAELAKSSTLEGASQGYYHILNWIRAASHIRISAQVGAVTRTIDVPIPWKLIDPTSSGNPLGSVTVLDRQVQGSLTYGSGLQVEVDQGYRHTTGAGGVFSSAPVTSQMGDYWNGVALNSVLYRPGYLSWMFTATYQNTDPAGQNYTTDSTLVGKFVVFDAANDSLAGRQKGHLNWGQGFGPSGAWGSTQWPSYNADGSYAGLVWADASAYRLPALTRIQAVKKAMIQSWIAHQADAYWAFRCLDPVNEANAGSGTIISNSTGLNTGTLSWGSSWASLTSALATASTDYAATAGNYSGWFVLNNTAAQGITATSGNSVMGMALISHLFPGGGTPATYAMARSLAQFTDPASVFNAVEGSDVSQCASSYLLLVTDGADDNAKGVLNANTASPYFTGSGASLALNAAAGNRAIIASPTSIDRSGAYWNIHTLAGIGAHLADPGMGTVNVDYRAALDPGSSARTGVPSSFLPMAIRKRNGITLSRDRRVTTLTLGVGLGGKYTDTNSPKRNLFLAAVAGDPGVTSGPLSGFAPFNPATDWIPDPRDPGSYPAVGKRRDGAIAFFDASDADRMATCMDYILRIATGTGTSQATASPNLPYVGASQGQEVYLGRFSVPANGGTIWTGDLLMFGLGESGGAVTVLDKDGKAPSTLDATTAIWSAATALQSGPVGTARKLFTRIPYGSALKPFTDAGTDFTDATSGLKKFVATGISDLATKQNLIRFAAGGDTTNVDASGIPRTNRASIMGDIINSTPAVAEYAWADVGGKLGAFDRLSAAVAAGGSRFRLLLVGTNQGWLHAFGEVTRTLPDGRVAGDIQELWSFMPTDFLANLNYLSNAGNPHRFMVDGSPAIYHLDLPPATGGPGNGVIDASERAVAVFGLRKGGRSYYALDIHDPFNPSLRWSLVPDEAASLGTGRVITGGPSLATVKDLVGKFGFSTSSPAFGRVIDPGGAYRDAVFLGGGYSNAETEANFSSTKLGRAVLALDAYTGEVLAATDLLADPAAGGSTPGPIAAGAVPFEFIVNSGMAQRAYFVDYAGGLWSWGSREVSATAPYVGFRKDSARIGAWGLRKVYQDDNAQAGARYTTLPAPFRVGNFPGRAVPGAPVPATVGVALVSGDRHNPLDRAYSAPTNPGPGRHRLTVVFDRQDSRIWGFDSASGVDAGMSPSNLRDFTANGATSTPSAPCSDGVFGAITPGCDGFYLAPSAQTPSFGYWIGLPAQDAATGFVPKGISPPLVSSGSLFYSYFTPETFNACTGGTGTTRSWLIADVLRPLVTDSRTGLFQTSGQKGTWAGVASDYLAAGTRWVLQTGMRQVTPANAATGTAAVTALGVSSTSTATTQRFAKPRVWRTIH